MKNRTLSLLALALTGFAGLTLQTRAQSIYTPYSFTNFAGMPGVSGTNDGTSNAARFFYPVGLAVDCSNNLYLADQENFTIRKITPAAIVTTLAGSPRQSGSVDG